MVNADLLGVVLNKLPAKGPDAYAYTYYTYDSKATGRKSPRKQNRPEETLVSSGFNQIIFGEPDQNVERR